MQIVTSHVQDSIDLILSKMLCDSVLDEALLLDPIVVRVDKNIGVRTGVLTLIIIRKHGQFIIQFKKKEQYFA